MVKKEIKKLIMTKKGKYYIHMYWNNWILDRKKISERQRRNSASWKVCWSYVMFKGPSANMEER